MEFSITIAGCKIYGNIANGKPSDLENEYWGRLALMDDHAALVALYEEDGLIPNLWAVDICQNGRADMDEKPNMIFTMTFATADQPDPEPIPDPTPEPTPEPEPTPTPTPDPEPAIPSFPSGGHSRPSTTPKPAKAEEPKETTLTNGKAVLKAPEALYWAGYDSRGGGAEAVTRADLAFLILSMMDQKSREIYFTKEAPFDDAPPDVWYTAAIGTMENTGIMVGCGNQHFVPEGRLTWGELITVMARFTKREKAPPEVYTGQHWAKNAINTAISLGWLEHSEAFDPGNAITCEQMVDFIQAVFQWASD